MNELVFIQNNEILVSSKDIAINFSKRHDHVLRDIENIKEKDVPNFEEMFHKGESKDSYGRSQPCYFMNRDGFTLLAMGFTGKQALDWKIKYINAFNQMEKQLKSTTPQLTSEELMAKALIEANSVLARQSKQLEEQKPKVLFADSVIASKNSILIRELAKLIKQNGYDIGEKKLYRWLREKGYICKNSTEPTQMAMNLGLFEIVVRTIERGDAPPRATRTTKVTGKGQVYFINKLCNSNCSLYDLEPLF